FSIVPDTLAAAPDVNTLDVGSIALVAQPAVTTNNVQTIGLLTGTGAVEGSQAVTIPANTASELTIHVSQSGLAAVANAYQLEVVDSSGQVVFAATTSGQALVGNVANLGVLGIAQDGTLTAEVGNLPAGTYTVQVVSSASSLTALLDPAGAATSGNGAILLQELGADGVVLGPDNEALVLNTVVNALNGSILGIPLNLGSTVQPLLQAVFDQVNAAANATPVSDLVSELSGVLSNSTVSSALGLAGLSVDSVLNSLLSTVSSTLLNNTLTLLQTTTVTTQLSEYQFGTGGVSGGNVITGVAETNTPSGADTLGAAGTTTVTKVAAGTAGTPQIVGATGTDIAGQYGTLHINPDGSYTYTASNNPASVGHSDVFTYTISDGTASASTTLTINIADTVAPTETPKITGIDGTAGTGATWTTTDTAPTIDGTLDAPLGYGEKVQVSTDGGLTWHDATINPADSSGLSWFYGTDALAAGTYNVEARIVDEVGNVDSNVASQSLAIDTSNVAPQVGSGTSLLGGIANVGALGLLDTGTSAFMAIDANNDLTKVTVQFSDTGVGIYAMSGLTQLATELGLTLTETHTTLVVTTSSTLTLTSATPGGVMTNEAVKEVLDTFYLQQAVNIGAGGNYTITATDSHNLSTSTSSSGGLLAVGVGSTMSSSILFSSTAGATIAAPDNHGYHLYGFGTGQTLQGGDGSDLLRGQPGAADSLHGGAGNDVLVYNANDIVIDGGSGSDTLLIEDAVASITATSGTGGTVTPVTNIETIQLGDDNNTHTLSLDATGAAHATGLVAGGTLTINGNGNDTVNLSGGVFTGQVLLNNHAYNQYALGSTTVLLEDGIHAHVTP
ncbi:VCBS domain-containing protein, partial [Burkholderia pyrrocinia]|uniref:beta strand repeat-containing protein n=1 Tax=Burkholderia pyrrocinia TaxID=60550 RepID=UPI002AAFECDF